MGHPAYFRARDWPVDAEVGEQRDLVGEDEFGDGEVVLVGEGEELCGAREWVGKLPIGSGDRGVGVELGLGDDEAAADGVEDVGCKKIIVGVESGEAETIGMRGRRGLVTGVGGGIGGKGGLCSLGEVALRDGCEGGCRLGGDGVHLVAVKEEVLGFLERYFAATEKREALGRANGGDCLLNQGGIDGVGCFAGEAEEDGAVCAVADAGESERAVKVDGDVVRAIEVTGTVKLADEAERGTHGADSVRTGGADADLKEFEEAGVHPPILGFGLRRWLAVDCDFGGVLRVACFDLMLL